MTLNTKRIIIAVLGGSFLLSLLFVQWMEVARKREESGIAPKKIHVPASSKQCVECHDKESAGITAQWRSSTHAEKGVGCVDCHQAEQGEADAYSHEGALIATIVTPGDCARCHKEIQEEFAHSHHAKAGNILDSLDNYLAETVEGSRAKFKPHMAADGRKMLNGMASVNSGCKQCHGSKVAIETIDGGIITVDDLKPGPDGKPTNLAALSKIAKNKEGRPKLQHDTWPNTGIGRLNLDGTLGSCTACHSRHDFSPRRARRPENCGKCHLGPDHPQKEIYEESKHGVAFRDLKNEMNLDSVTWILGKDYSQAPTCATCHMSGNSRNGGKITHDPGIRISWTNRPPASLRMDTTKDHKVVKVSDPAERQKLTADSWQNKRQRMRDVCMHCHSSPYISAFYSQYDDFIHLYNNKFAEPGKRIMAVLLKTGIRTKPNFDEEIEWTWFYLWHHEGRRARHGVSMMAPDYSHWHGMYEVAERFYMELIPQAREMAEHARAAGKGGEADQVEATIDEILARTEHKWFPNKPATHTPPEGDKPEDKDEGDEPPKP